MADTRYVVESGFYDSVNRDRLYSADQMNEPYKMVFTEGIINGGFAVTQNSPAGMSVLVAPGNALLGGKWVASKTQKILTVPENTAMYGRYDAVILQVDTNTDVRDAAVVYRTGTPAADPAVPSLINTGGISEVMLAYITVAAGATSISTSYIHDARGGEDCPYMMMQVGDAQIQAAVEDVLEAHPEWTTTVEDGSITLEKLAAGVIDNTLSVSGAAADAKATGDALSDLNNDLQQKADKINLEIASGFDDSPVFYVNSSYIFIWWTSQFHIRGVSGRNKDVSLPQAKTQVGNEHVATSPDGKESIVIGGTEWLVYDVTADKMSVIDRSDFNFNSHIMLLSQIFLIPNGGLLMSDFISWLIGEKAAKPINQIQTTLLTKSNTINDSFVIVFDDACYFEEDDNYSYVAWASQFHFRGIATRNQDISLAQAKTQVGSDNVKTAPSGIESIAISNNNWLVYDFTDSSVKVISKDSYDYNNQTVLLARAYGKTCGGVMFQTLLQNEIKSLDTKNNNKDNVKLLNARHISGGSATPLTLLHFSDLHKDTDALKRIVTDAVKYENKIDGMICTGDMVPNTSEQISSWWDSRVMTCIGNHDTASYSEETGYDWTALSMANRDAYYIAPFESNWGITHTSGMSYYYKDYASAKVRLIVMDVMLYNDNGAEATAQTAWLENLLADAITNNLHVLIAIHAPHGGANAEECSFSRYGQTAMPVLSDCNTPQTVIDAVASKISSGLKFCGYICGHTHQDNIWDASGDGSQFMFCITCANVETSAQWINSDQSRNEFEDAYNLVTIDTTHSLIKLIRCGGADMDDHMRPRRMICFDYSAGEMVGEE